MCPPGECARQAHGVMHMSIRQPPTGVCQANKEPDRREMKLTVLQVSGMGVPVSR